MTLYLCRAGRANMATLAESLDIPFHFATQIAKTLSNKKVFKSLRGPGGGYEIIGDPTVRDVLCALGSIRPLTSKESDRLSRGAVEHRALAQWARVFSGALDALLNQPVRSVSKALVVHELQRMNSVSNVGVC